MICIAKNLTSGSIGGNVPGVKLRYRANLPCRPVESTKSPRPYGENDAACPAEKRFVNYEFIVVVLVQALHARAIAPDSEHPGRRIARKDQPFRLEWMELGM